MMLVPVSDNPSLFPRNNSMSGRPSSRAGDVTLFGMSKVYQRAAQTVQGPKLTRSRLSKSKAPNTKFKLSSRYKPLASATSANYHGNKPQQDLRPSNQRARQCVTETWHISISLCDVRGLREICSVTATYVVGIGRLRGRISRARDWIPYAILRCADYAIIVRHRDPETDGQGWRH
jgi:hypothetical protein